MRSLHTTRRSLRHLGFMMLAALLLGTGLLKIIPAGASASSAHQAGVVAKNEVKASIAKLPMAFEPNQGQTDSRVKFLSRGAGYTVFLTGNEAVLRLNSAKENQEAVVRMQFVGSNGAARIEPAEQLAGKSNYLIGDSSRWVTKVPQYAEVHYKNVYAGIEVVFRGDQRQLRYDLVVKPGADPGSIELAFDGAEKTAVDKDGNLVLTVGGKPLIHKKPYIYQEEGGARNEVEGRYAVKEGRATFEIACYDASKPLVIDPTVVFASYLGGTQIEAVQGVAIDATGIYATGHTNSTDFPTTAGVFQGNLRALHDVFVTKMNLPGTALAYSTYLGGTNNDYGYGIAVDSSNQVVVVGQTFSSNFPGAANSLQGTNDGFIAKLNATGAALLFSRYIGGGTNEIATGVAVDAGGTAYVVGYSDSLDFPVTTGSANYGSSDAFVVKVSPAGAVGAAAVFGGPGAEFGRGIALNAGGDIFIVGDTTSVSGIHTASAYDSILGGPRDAFVIRVNSSLSKTYGTYLGGSGVDIANGVAEDSAGVAYVAGGTDSANFPTTAGAYQTAVQGQGDAFVAAIDPSKSGAAQLAYSTYFGGVNSADVANAIAIDGDGQVYIAGVTGKVVNPGAGFPTFNQAVDGGLGTGGFRTAAALLNDVDAFVARLNPRAANALPAFPQLNFSNFFKGDVAGNKIDTATSIAVSGDRTVVIGGQTDSYSGISTGAPTYQRDLGGSGPPQFRSADGFVAALSFNDVVATPNALSFDYADSDGILLNSVPPQTFVVSFTTVTPPPPSFTLPANQAAINYSTTNPGGIQWLQLPTQDVTPGVVRVRIDETQAKLLLESPPGSPYTASFLVSSPTTDNQAALVKVSLVKRPCCSSPLVNLNFTTDRNNPAWADPPAASDHPDQPNNLATADYLTTTPRNVVVSANPAVDWLQVNIAAAVAFSTLTSPVTGTNVIPAPGDGVVSLVFRTLPATLNLPAGTYTTTVSVAASRAKNSPLTFVVTLLVLDTAQRIQITPTSASLYAGQTVTLYSTVANPNPANPAPFTPAPPNGDLVNWAITAGPGTLSNAGPSSSTVYTAPASIASPTTVTITASRPNTGKVPNPTTESVTFNLWPASAVQIAPTAATLYANQTQLFTASVSNAPGVNPTYSIVSGLGTINASSGIYQAPATVASQSTATVRATIVAPDGTRTSDATVTLLPPSTVAISPTTATLYQGQTQLFTATTTNPPGLPVSYSVTAGPGSVNASSGLYTAPAVIANPDTATVTATINAPDGVKTSNANITLLPPSGISVTGARAYAYAGQTVQFTATTTNPPGLTPITFSVITGPGTINANTGLYTAPASVSSSTSVVVQASVPAPESGTRTATAPLTLLPPSLVNVTPTSVSLYQNWTQLFIASPANAPGVTPTYSVSSGPGSVDATGLYTAPASISTPTTAIVTVTLVALDATRTAQATVNLLPPTSISMIPATATLYAGQTQQFTATTSPPGGAVAFSISPAVGSIAPGGLYTAPGSVAAVTTVIVTATYSAPDAVRTAQSTITLLPPSAVTIAPTSTSLRANQTQQFIATVSYGSGATATFSLVSGPGSVNSSTGLYTAPSSIPTQTTATVRATVVAPDGTRTADATVTLLPPGVVTVTPGTVSLYANGTQQFSAAASDDPSAVFTWSISPSVGSVSSSGFYTAPASITLSQTVIVTATTTHQTYGTRSGSATVTLLPPVVVILSPTTAFLYPAQTQQFVATVLNTSNSAVTWSLNPNVGTISAAGLYTAPASVSVLQTVTVTATSVADPTKFASAVVTLSPPIAVTVLPATVNLFAGQSQAFSATVTNTPNTAVTWSMTGVGSIDSSGVYTAPSIVPSTQSAAIRATSVADPTKYGTATVQVFPGIIPPPSNTAFVQRLYLDFMGRPADNAGLNYWVGILVAGTMTREQVAQSFFNSPEFRDTGLFIANAYTGILNRDADYAGFTFWLAQIRAGGARTSLVNLFITSPEFQATYGSLTNTQFVQLVYQNVLGRAADSGGLAFWVGALNAGLTRAQMMEQFITSPEYASRIRTRQLANLAYLGFLARTPDPVGRLYWTNFLNLGGSELQLINYFISSDEFKARFS